MKKVKRILSLLCVLILLITGYGAVLQYAVYAATRSYTLSASDGRNYRVNVSFDASSGIPGNAVLDVKEIVKQSASQENADGLLSYDEYVSESARLLDSDPKDFAFARVFDITLRDPDTGETFQPAKDVVVRIVLIDEDLETGLGDIDVVHFGDEKEIMASSVSGSSVEFRTDGFSAYVVVAHEGDENVATPRVQFHFIDPVYHTSADSGYETLSPLEYQAGEYWFPNKGGTDQTSQILINGESLEYVKNPANRSVDDGNGGLIEQYFFGWYLVDGRFTDDGSQIVYSWSDDPLKLSFERPLTLTLSSAEPVVGDIVYWRIEDAFGSATLDEQGTAHVFLAPVYEDYYFINFHLGTKDDVNLALSLYARKMVVLGSDEKVTTRIGNISSPSTNPTKYVFSGWETIDEHGFTVNRYRTVDLEGNEIDSSNTSQNGEYYATFSKSDFVEEEIDLYPVFDEARWIYFNTGRSGNGATYVPAKYRITNDDDGGTWFETLPVSERPGYKLEGWYADAVVDSDGNILNVDTAMPVEIHYFDNAGNLQTVTENRRAYKLTQWVSDQSCAFTAPNYSNTVTVDGTAHTRFTVENGKLYVYKGLEALNLYAEWTPVLTPYTAVYWLQNANDDNYTLLTYEVLQGLSGTQTEATQIASNTDLYRDNKLRFCHLSEDQDKSTAGVQSGIRQQTIEGDGSTIVNVYYDRNIYTLRFDIGFARQTGTTGSTTVYSSITPADAASYSGTVYGVVGGSYVALIKDVNGNWVISDADGDPYGVVEDAYVPLDASIESSVNLYRPEYAYTPSTASDAIYGVDENGDYVVLDVSETTDTTTQYVYRLTNTMTNGVQYLILNGNSAGTRYALGHNGNTVTSNGVTVNAATTEISAPYVSASAVNGAWVWTASASGTSWKLVNNGYYLRRNNNNGTTLQANTTDQYNTWNWASGNNRLQMTIGRNTYNLRFYNNNFSLSTANNSVYLYEYVPVEVQTTVYEYSIGGVPYTGTRYTRAGNDGTAVYPETDMTHVVSHNGGTYFYDAEGTYGEAGAYISTLPAGTQDTYSYSYNGNPYTGTVYPMAVYGGALYRQTTMQGTWEYFISYITNAAQNGGYDGFLTTTNYSYSLGNTNPFGPDEYNGTYTTTAGGSNYIVFYYEITGKYGQNIINEYPGTQPKRVNGSNSYLFVGWIPQQDSYYWYRVSSSIKGLFETISEDLILTGGNRSTGYVNGGRTDGNPDTYTAVSISDPAHDTNTTSGEYGITQEFHCRYTTLNNSHKYLYRIYLADVDTREYPDEPTSKFVITAGSGSNPKDQTPPTYYGYTLVDTKVINNAGTELNPASNNTYGAYTVAELEAAEVGTGMIMVFRFQPKDHMLIFKDSNNNELGSYTYYYGQDLSAADDAHTQLAIENTPEGHTFAGWYENIDGVGNAFDFNRTMPDGQIVLYAIYKPVRYRVMIDPNGAEIDHVNHNYDNNGDAMNRKGYSNYWWDADGNAVAYSASAYDPSWVPFATFNRSEIYNSEGDLERAADVGYRNDQSTYFNGTFGERVGEYALNRTYVPLSDTAAEDYAANGGTVYYYVNTQYLPTDGSSLPSDLRNSLYMTESELHQYYLFYRDWVKGNLQGGYISGTTLLGEAAWRNTYVSQQKYRYIYSGEHYEFLGWYEVFYDDEGNETGTGAMPYNFSTPVSGPLTIRAQWRLDAGYRIHYIPEYKMDDGTIINGAMFMDQWEDPFAPGSNYADGSKTEILQQPTGLTANGISTDEYIFRGWRLVSLSLDASSNTVYNPLEPDNYYDPGDDFIVSAAYADKNSYIYIQAVYEEKDSSYRRPYVTALTLDANSGYLTTGSYYDGDDLVTGTELQDLRELDWDGVGTLVMDPDTDTIAFGNIQSSVNARLYRYSTKLTENLAGGALDPVGVNYFKHPSGYLLIGFDDDRDEGDYVATYPADSLVAVQRHEDRTIYAVWEPMVYLNIVNNTEENHGDITLSLTSTDGTALTVVNEKRGVYERVPLDSLSSIVVRQGETLRLAIPNGAEKNITVSGTNELGTGYMLYWQADMNGAADGHPSGHVENLGSFSITDMLKENSDEAQKGLTVTFTTRKADKVLILDQNWNGSRTEVYFSNYSSDENYVGLPYTLPGTGTRLAWTFVGWDEDSSLHPDIDNGTNLPEYLASNADSLLIASMADFFEAKDTDHNDVVTLYAIWSSDDKANTVRVYKLIPEPGKQDKNFDFTVSFRGSYRNDEAHINGTITERTSPAISLSNEQYMVIVTEVIDGESTGKAKVTQTIQKYGTNDQPIGSPVIVTTGDINVSAVVNFNLEIKVLEADYTNYITTSSVESEIIPDSLETNGKLLSWTNYTTGGTVFYTNARKTAEVTVRKVLRNHPTDMAFTFTGSYVLTEDGVTVTKNLRSISVLSSSASGTAFEEKIPVGAVLTVTEIADNSFDVAAAALNGSADTDAADKVYTFTVTADETLVYTNTLKSYPVRIVLVGFDGTTTYTDVEAQFSLRADVSSIVNHKYTTPDNNTVYNGILSVGEYSLIEHWVQSGYLGLGGDVTLTVSGDDTVTSNDAMHVVVTGNKTDGFLVTVYNQKTVDLSIEKVLIDPLLGSGRTFYFAVSYQNTLNGVTENVSRSGDTAISVASGGHASFTVPIGVTGLTVAEETSRRVSSSSTVTIGETYETYYRITNGSNEVVPADTGSSYTYSAVAASNAGDLITFTNKAKTVDVTVEKRVTAEDTSGTFSFTATLSQGASGIPGYAIFVNGTPADESDDVLTDTNGQYTFSLRNGEAMVLTLPVGARLQVRENGVSGTTDPALTLEDYQTTAAAYFAGGGGYTGSSSWVEGTRVYTIVKVPADDLDLIFTNGSGGKEVFFRKINGFGEPLPGAAFSLYTSYSYAVAKGSAGRVSLTVDSVKTDTVTSASALDSNGYNVAFKVPNGVYYMTEIGAVSGYSANGSIYRVTVGAAGSTVDGITLPAGSEYLIQLMSDSSTVSAVPDVSQYGVLNESQATREVVFRKINTGYQSLAGAKFDILRADMTVVASDCVSGETGVFWIGELPYGKYYLKETEAPAGYNDAPVWFEIRIDGSGISARRLTTAP